MVLLVLLDTPDGQIEVDITSPFIKMGLDEETPSLLWLAEPGTDRRSALLKKHLNGGGSADVWSLNACVGFYLDKLMYHLLVLALMLKDPYVY